MGPCSCQLELDRPQAGCQATGSPERHPGSRGAQPGADRLGTRARAGFLAVRHAALSGFVGCCLWTIRGRPWRQDLRPLSRDSSCSGTSRISKSDRPSSHDPAGHQQQYCIGEIGLCSVVAAELAYGVEKSGSIRNRQAL